MQIGMIGLGRMGSAMVRRLAAGGHACVVHDVHASAIEEALQPGIIGAVTLADLVGRLAKPRVVWLMLPAAVVDQELSLLTALLESGDIVIDGGNSYYRDDLRRAAALKPRGLHYVDVGTSGGVAGLARGYCLMIGGEAAIVARLDPLFATLAPGGEAAPRTPDLAASGTAERGYLHCGPHGAGHFVKMVHNGIEYGIMQSFAEGFDVLKNATTFGYEVPIPDIAAVWRRGSVISSWLLDLAAIALAKSRDLAAFEGHVADSGEGRWTIQAAVEAGVPCPVLSASLYARFRSRVDHTFGDKMLSAMRFGFGGHVESSGQVKPGHSK